MVTSTGYRGHDTTTKECGLLPGHNRGLEPGDQWGTLMARTLHVVSNPLRIQNGHVRVAGGATGGTDDLDRLGTEGKRCDLEEERPGRVVRASTGGGIAGLPGSTSGRPARIPTTQGSRMR